MKQKQLQGNYDDEMDNSSETSSHTALLPKSVLMGKQYEVGDTLTVKVTAIRDDEIQVKVTGSETEEPEPEEEVEESSETESGEDMASGSELEPEASMPAGEGNYD